jgi:hypothetical protein
MNIGNSMVLTAFLACSTVQAQTCSGGSDGGMDATGNQCNTPDSYLERTPAWTASARPVAGAATPAVRLRHTAVPRLVAAHRITPGPRQPLHPAIAPSRSAPVVVPRGDGERAPR